MERNFDDLTEDIKNVPASAQWLNEPYIGGIRIKSIEYSEDVKNKQGQAYTGKPFFKYEIETTAYSEPYFASITLWRPSPGDDEKKKVNKLKKLKDFYAACGISDNLKGQAWVDAIVGKECNAVLTIQEKLFLAATPPRVLKEVNLWYAKGKNENIDQDISNMYQPLSVSDSEKLKIAIDNYNAMNPSQEKNESDSSSSEEVTDDF